MFNEEFYPTPENLACPMLSGVKFDDHDAILEPSAGKGDLADQIRRRYARNNREDDIDLDTLEYDPELRMILKGKGYRVVGVDFLQFDTFKRYDWILMNPPFSNGDAHLLKALSLLKPGGTCVCLLNAETLDNPYSNARIALTQKLEDWNAEIDYIEKAFKNAERTTDVRIAIVRAKCPEDLAAPSIVLEGLKKDFLDRQTETPPSTATLVHHDFTKQIIERFRFEAMAGMRLFDVWEELGPYMRQTFEKPDEDGHLDQTPIIQFPITRNEYLQQLRAKYWQTLFDDEHFSSQLTLNLKSQLRSLVHSMRDYDFSEDNILALQQEVQSKAVSGVEATIMNLFDEITVDHRWFPECKRNIHYFNGWATNHKDCRAVGNKVILPWNNVEDSWWSSEKGKVRFKNTDRIVDMELCLDYLDGSKRDCAMSTMDLLNQAEHKQQTSKIQLRHCEVTFYKKGTTHFRFLNPETVQKSNIFVGRQKQWLPPSYGKKAYSDLSPEEKTVIDSFEGEQSYRTVCTKPELLISAETMIPLLAAS